MHRVTFDMEMSCDDAIALVESALAGMPGVVIARSPRSNGCRLTIDSDDPDAFDIIREIVWEQDPTAVQHSVTLEESLG